MTTFLWQIPLLCLLLSGLAVTVFTIATHQGMNATVLLLLGVSALVFGRIHLLVLRQFKLPEQLFRALANGDNSLGLPPNHPLRQHFEQARQRMQQARFSAEEQAQFLRQVLLHSELAILICDEQGRFIEQSPAAARLLGGKLTSLSELQQLQPSLAALILQQSTATSPQARSTLTLWRGEQPDTLSVAVHPMTIARQAVRIVTLNSIHQPLNLREQAAYSRLTRVLTHEIANSVTPLASLAQTCHSLLPEGLCFTNDEDKSDLQLALKTLSNRTHHLSVFIEGFRQVNRLAPPQLTTMQLTPLLEQVLLLFKEELTTQQIETTLSIEVQRTLPLDPAQIEQVLINLLKNAIEAFQSQPTTEPKQIRFTLGTTPDQQLMLEVRDNGPGITATAAEMIFVPFFTTKQQGSGVGLALSRQIMINHGGDLIMIKTAQGACFRLLF